MISNLFHWDILYKIILNTLFVSIPEEFYLLMFTLILMGEFDYWNEAESRKLFERWDYVRVFIPVIASAIASNIARYMGIEIDLVSIITFVSLFILIILTNDVLNNATQLQWIGKAFIFLLLAVLSILVIESLYMPFVLYGTGKTIEELNNNALLNIGFSLPERAVECAVFIFFIAKKRTLLKANLIGLIFESKIMVSLVSLILVSNVGFMVIMIRIINYEKYLLSMPTDFRAMVIIGTCMFPFINIAIFLWGTYYIKNHETHKRKDIAVKMDELIEDIKLCTKNETYDNIKWKLNGIEKDMEALSTNMYHPVKANKRG